MGNPMARVDSDITVMINGIFIHFRLHEVKNFELEIGICKSRYMNSEWYVYSSEPLTPWSCKNEDT